MMPEPYYEDPDKLDDFDAGPPREDNPVKIDTPDYMVQLMEKRRALEDGV